MSRRANLLLAGTCLCAVARAGAGDLAAPELLPVRAPDVPAQLVQLVLAVQTGRDNRLQVAQAGQHNVANLQQQGDANRAVTRQDGAANVVSLRQDGAGRRATVEQYGVGNRADVVQGPQAPAVLVQQRGNLGYASVVQN